MKLYTSDDEFVAAYRSYYLSQPWAKYAYTEAPAWAM